MSAKVEVPDAHPSGLGREPHNGHVISFGLRLYGRFRWDTGGLPLVPHHPDNIN